MGAIYYRAPKIHLDRLISRIAEAENTVETKVSKNTGKSYPNTSKARSEVGAISSIATIHESSKRDFSTLAAIESYETRDVVSGYILELFDTPQDPEIADDILGSQALEESLTRIIRELGPGTRAFQIPSVGRTSLIELQLTVSDAPALFENLRNIQTRGLRHDLARAAIDLSPDRHENALIKLAGHPLVRRIGSPLTLDAVKELMSNSSNETLEIPIRDPDAKYPVVGVIDTGIAECLDEWTVGRFDYLDDNECDQDHGTKVAGVVSVGSLVNDADVQTEQGRCLLYDGALYPKEENFWQHYPRGFTDFLEELEQCVSEAVAEHKVRIFNLSINAVSDVESYSYSLYAGRLDEIADKYNVIFVNSVGNLKLDQRTTWPSSPRAAVQYFADRAQSDPIQKPSESVRSISVGALNPPRAPGLTGAPTTYTRRGPALEVGVKPDVACFGGDLTTKPTDKSGFNSIDTAGTLVEVAGTSFAAPLVARTLAELDNMTQGVLSKEALRAMLVHNATVPVALDRKGLKNLARQFSGFGQPSLAIDMVETNDHEVTMVFQSRLTAGDRSAAILRFPFVWPSCLVDSATGSCSGAVRMTLVSSPPLDPAYGAEFVRVNLDAKLLQYKNRTLKNGLPSYTQQVKPRFKPDKKGLGLKEKSLIDHGLKWWPTKQYQENLNSRGESSEWRLEVSSLVRSESNFPAAGIPFAVILTIKDKTNSLPVFAHMRQSLQASAAKAVDIRKSIRIQA